MIEGMKHLISLITFLALTLISCAEDQGVTVSGLKELRIKPHNQFGPNYSWWGYNMSKAARHQETVYFGLLKANADGNTDVDMNFDVYKVNSGGTPERVVRLKSNRAGNVLVDSSGALHVIVYEPLDAEVVDSAGRAVHYYYSGANSGDFTQTARNVIASAENLQDLQVNMRIGATISDGDRLAVSFGAPPFHGGYDTNTIKLYLKEPEKEWTTHVLEDVGHEYYYPFVVDKDQRTFLLPVQDDYATKGSKVFNRYYKIPLFRFDGATWSNDMIIDRSNHALAADDEKPTLVTQLELFHRTNGNLVAIYRDESYSESRIFMREILKDGSIESAKELKWARSKNISWVSAFEIDSKLYFFATSWGDRYFARASDQKAIRVFLPNFQDGGVGFLSSARGGVTQNAYQTIDILSGGERSPSEGASLYQIPKKSIKKLF
jgi:hypothetical protein